MSDLTVRGIADEVAAWVREKVNEDERYIRDGRCDCYHAEDHGRCTAPDCPAHIRREIEAKRLILDEHTPGSDICDAHDAGLRTIPCPTLLALAWVYAGRLGYRSEWAP